MTNIFDTHAHYASRQFDGDRADLLAALSRGGVVGVAGVGGTFQHPNHAALGQGLQQCDAVSVKLTRGIVRVGVKNVRHALASCGARLTR